MPGKNDKVKTKGIYKQKRVLSDSLAYLHLKYNTEATRKISLATFCRMRPKHIALTRYLSRNKCLCQKHQNMALTLKAMKNVGITVPLNPNEYERKVRGNEEIMQTCFVEMKDGEVALQQWQKVEQADGKKRTKIVEKRMLKDELVSIVQKQTADFLVHCSRVKAQYTALNNLKEKLPEKQIIVQMDFAENFICMSADEVQSAYWNSAAVTLHPVVVYFKEEGSLKHKNYVIVSDDHGHNIGLVYAILKDLVSQIKECR